MSKKARTICRVFSIVLLFSALTLSSISLYILFFRHTIMGIFDLLAIIIWVVALVIIPTEYKTKIAASFISFGAGGILLLYITVVNAIKSQAASVIVRLSLPVWIGCLCFFTLLILLGVVIKPKTWKKQYILCLLAIISGICIIWLAIYLHANPFIEVNPTFIAILFILGILDILFGYWVGPHSIKEPNNLFLTVLIIITTLLVWASVTYTWQRGILT